MLFHCILHQLYILHYQTKFKFNIFFRYRNSEPQRVREHFFRNNLIIYIVCIVIFLLVSAYIKFNIEVSK